MSNRAPVATWEIEERYNATSNWALNISNLTIVVLKGE